MTGLLQNRRRPFSGTTGRPAVRKKDRNRPKNLSQGLLQRVDMERRRISADLHDSTAQVLIAACMSLSRAERASGTLAPEVKAAVAESRALIERSIQEVRALSYFLHPPLLDEAGLATALSWYVDSFAKSSGFQVRLDAPDPLRRLPYDVELALFRIAEESLENAGSHSGGSTAGVQLKIDGEEVVLTVSDDGHGIPRGTLKKVLSGSHPGMGIAGMQERAGRFGGRLKIVAGRHGTSITVHVPIPGGNS